MKPSVARRNESSPGLLRLFTLLAAEAADPDNAAHGFFEKRSHLFRTTLADQFARAQEAGDVAPDADPLALATNVMALWDGLQLYDPLTTDNPTWPTSSNCISHCGDRLSAQECPHDPPAVPGCVR